MSIHLSQHGVLLLPAQLRLEGTFQHRLIRRGMGLPCAGLETARLSISQEPKAVSLTLRHGPTHHSCSIPRTSLRTVVTTAQQWIDDALNGQLEVAA